MNGLNSVGSAADAGGPASASAAGGADFEAVINQGIANTSILMLQLIGGDIIQSVMKDETAVD